MKSILIVTLLLFQVIAQGQRREVIASTKIEKQLIKVSKANIAPLIDGKTNDAIWNDNSWHPINQLWLGNVYEANDFNGKFKLGWTNDALYVLVKIQDDILLDQQANPLKFWWDDDCVEVFIDEDNSGGEHQYNHNAFAYHIALDGNVVDMAPGGVPKFYNHHIESKRITKGNISIWELKISIYNDNYNDNATNTSIELNSGKKLGFAIAYCDNDRSKTRENFIGSIFVKGDDKNKGWIDANIFGTIILTN